MNELPVGMLIYLKQIEWKIIHNLIQISQLYLNNHERMLNTNWHLEQIEQFHFWFNSLVYLNSDLPKLPSFNSHW